MVNLEATMGKAFELKFMLKEGSLSRLTTAQLVAELARNWEEVAHFVLALFDIVQRRRVRAYYESVFNRYPLKMAGQGVQCKRDAYAALQVNKSPYYYSTNSCFMFRRVSWSTILSERRQNPSRWATGLNCSKRSSTSTRS